MNYVLLIIKYFLKQKLNSQFAFFNFNQIEVSKKQWQKSIR